MANTNHERVGKSLELLRDGLAPFVRREVTAKLRAGTVRMDAIRRFTEDPRLANKPFGDWDAAALLKLMWDTWNDVFRDTLGFIERSLVSELRDWRNKWAHQERFVSDDADRALDSVERLLTAIAAPQADEVARIKRELRRLVFDEQVRGERRTKQEEPRQGQVTHVEQPYGKMRKVRDVILRHIETKTAANPPLGNQAIADIVNAEIPGGRTSAASVASVRSVERAKRPAGEIAQAPRSGSGNRGPGVKVRDVILRHIETKTAANPPLGNQAIADIVNAEIPGGRTSAASVASVRSVERAKRPAGEIAQAPRSAGGNRGRGVMAWIREHVLRPDGADDATIAKMRTNRELVGDAAKAGVSDTVSAASVSSVRSVEKRGGADVVSSAEIMVARARVAKAKKQAAAK